MSPPKFIYLVRHGQSEANVDWDLLKTVPDWKIPLTEYGRQQSVMAGAYIYSDLRKEFPKGMNNPLVTTYCSPYVRTRQTWDAMWGTLCDTNKDILKYLIKKPRYVYGENTKYDPRIREQDWGNYKDPEVSKKIDAERDKFGTFFYRIPDGESGADVYDRLSSFMETLWRDFDKPSYPQVCIIVTHGLTMRLLITRWFHWDIEYYESLQNPKNGEVWRISRNDNGKWHIDTQIRFKEIIEKGSVDGNP